METVEQIAVARLRRDITEFAQRQVPNNTPRGKGKNLLLWKITRWAVEQQLSYERDMPLDALRLAADPAPTRTGTLDIVLAGRIAINVCSNNNHSSLAGLEYAAERGKISVWVRWGAPHALDVPSNVYLICLANIERPLGLLIAAQRSAEESLLRCDAILNVSGGRSFSHKEDCEGDLPLYSEHFRPSAPIAGGESHTALFDRLEQFLKRHSSRWLDGDINRPQGTALMNRLLPRWAKLEALSCSREVYLGARRATEDGRYSYRGYVDFLIGNHFAIEVDRSNKRWSLEKLVHAVGLGYTGIWVRWGAPVRLSIPDKVRLIDLTSC